MYIYIYIYDNNNAGGRAAAKVGCPPLPSLRNIFVCIFVIVFAVFSLCSLFSLFSLPSFRYLLVVQDSAKGGAVETGCSDLHDVIHYLII